jgi:PKD repeat protein
MQKRLFYFTILAVIALVIYGCAPEPVANFNFSYTGNVAPADVSFTNLSTDAEEYRWEFGDGNTSTATSPTHTYLEGGDFSITLTATGKGGESFISKNITIIQPTSYIFKNGSSITLEDVFSFYLQGDTPIEEVSHGTMYSGNQTSEVITDRTVIDVIFEFFFDGVSYIGYLGSPYNFNLTPNSSNLLTFDDYTTFYWTEQTTSVKSTSELESIRQKGTFGTLHDLMK